MKKIFLLLFSLLSIAATAQNIAEGFYRVVNYKTNRTLFVQDDRAAIYVQAGTADLGAITPWTEAGKSSICDPQSIVYVRPNGDGYDLLSQGMSTYEKIQMPIKIQKYGNTDTYRCSATKSGITLYLCDETTSSDPEGFLGTKIPNNDMDYTRWYPKAVDVNSDNYFGIKPKLEVDGKYYTTFYAAFSFKVVSSGVKVYIVSEIGNGEAVVKDVTDQKIEPGTPVIFECSSKNPADNKIELLGVGGSPLSNKLTGVYFCNYPDAGDGWNHKNVTVYNSSTMRVLGKASNGKLAFIKTSDKDLLVEGWVGEQDVLCIPANTAVLKAPAEKLSDEMFVVTSASGIEDIAADVNEKQVVYSLLGVKVGEYDKDVNLSDVLPKGLYVVNNKKLIVK